MAGTKKLRVLLKGGWALGVQADEYHPQKRSGNFGSDVALMSFTKRGDEVCAVLLSELVAIAEEDEVWMEPVTINGHATEVAAPARRRSPRRNGSPKVKRNGRGR